MRSTKLAVTLGALAFSTAISALPALAQEYHTGRAANDGGPVSAQNQGQNTGSRSNEQSGGPMGNNYAFGAQGQPAQGRDLYAYSAPNSAAAGPQYKVGRAANDGGPLSAASDEGGQRTGSAANREANRSGDRYGTRRQPAGFTR